jgi:hypothetical protein
MSAHVFRNDLAKLTNVSHCPYCKNPKYNSGQKIGGHIRWCPERPPQVQEMYTPEELADENLEIDITDDAFIDTFAYLSQEFISSQKEYLSEECITQLQAGRVRLLSGDYKVANIRIYLEIARFVSTCVSLSGSNATELIMLMKRISYINGLEIPLSQKYETLRNNILATMEGRRAEILRVEYPLPRELYGDSASRSPPCISVMSPLLDMLKRYLLDDSIVGENGENFVAFGRKEFRNGERIFSDWTTGDYFLQYQEFVHARWGDDCIVLLILMSADKTNTNKHGSEQAYPAYFGLGNLQLLILFHKIVSKFLRQYPK